MGWMGKGITGLFAVLLIAFFCVDCAGRERLGRELDWLQARGEPLALEDFEPLPPREGSDLDVWLTAISEAEEAGDGYSERILGDIDYLREAVADLDPDHILARYLKSLEESGRGARAAWADTSEAIEFAVPFAELSERQQLAVRAAAAASGGLAEIGLDACNREGIEGRIDESSLFDRRTGERGLLVMRSGVAIVNTAHLAALEGRHDDALRAIESGFCAAEILESGSGFISFTAWAHLLKTTLDALRKALPHFPDDFDLSGIDQRIAAIDPLETFGYAMRTERIFAMAVARGRGNIELPTLAKFTRVFDQAELLGYLRTMQETIESGERFEGEKFEFPKYTQLARLMAVSGRVGDPALELMLSFKLARAARLACTEGLESARAFCETEGLPCRDEDEWWIAWGPGHDEGDDGGSARVDARGRPKDEVWRVRR